MAKGPSPLIPLLLLVALGLLLHSNSFPATLNLPLASEAENTIISCILFVPFLVLLDIYSTNHAILVPLALLLVTYVISTMLLGPLMLISIALVATKYSSSFKECNLEELGWGCLSLVFFLLLLLPQWVSLDEGRQSEALLVAAIMIFVYYHFGS
ncbi:hypothetical protein OROHE_009396 [Orobanche hederae]